jgi:hypothetical protein
LKGKVFHVEDINHLNHTIMMALKIDDHQFNTACDKILGYEEDPRERLRNILEDLTSQQVSNRYVVSEESLQAPNVTTQMLIYGATGKYFQFPVFNWLGRQAVTSVSIQYYLDGLMCNLATRSIPLREVLSVLTNSIMFCLCGSVRFKVVCKILVIYLMCIGRNFYSQIFSERTN